MSAAGGMIRDRRVISEAFAETETYLAQFEKTVRRPSAKELPLFYRVYDMLQSRRMYLYAMQDYAGRGAGSRGSALYTDPSGQMPGEGLPEIFRCTLDDGAHSGVVQEVRCSADGGPSASWRLVRPVPQPDDFFENQWRAYRARNRI
jgi:hypothetical protein